MFTVWFFENVILLVFEIVCLDISNKWFFGFTFTTTSLEEPNLERLDIIEDSIELNSYSDV